MIYLLDTNTCIGYMNGRSPNIQTRIRSTPAHDIVVPAVVRAELFYGAAKSSTPQASLAKQQTFLKPYVSLPFDDAAAASYGSIRAQLEKQGTPIGPVDLLIAAVVLTHNLILVTHNTAEFSRVSGLKLDDWEI